MKAVSDRSPSDKSVPAATEVRAERGTGLRGTGLRSTGLRAYGGVEGDERISRRRETLMDATLGVLATEGAVTVRGICRAAGLNPRYFYESFESADALVAATFDRVIEEISDAALAAFTTATGGGVTGKVAGAVTAIVEIIDADRRKGKLLFSPSLLSPIVAAKRSESTGLFAMLTLHTATDALATEVGAEAIAAAQFQVGGLGRLLSAWLDGEVPLGRVEVVALSVRLMMSLVGAVTGRDDDMLDR
ncbi:TetR/AcrR family transcriptional regulator [Gordonia sp. DT219]|uniref:TetR/AcrR family transcriptional regulator n=1 Tax=Gordonia sp. DT219 TaxID=3416658 RepID=UPI003CF18402